ncbi:hypothetical protein TNCV_4968981 [Trichonephila clavipes]|nr:hypothetical protein TNCV_4968981 [Trichonephila clavipes]
MFNANTAQIFNSRPITSWNAQPSKNGNGPSEDSLREILYIPDAPRIAEAVIKTSTEFSDIYCIYSWTQEQQQHNYH